MKYAPVILFILPISCFAGESDNSVSDSVQDYYNCAAHVATQFAKTSDSADVVAEGAVNACDDFMLIFKKEVVRKYNADGKNILKMELKMKERAKGIALSKVLDERSKSK